MVFEGRVVPPKRNERYWQAGIPYLGVFTQGKTERDAYAMAADALETLVGRRNFRVQVLPAGARRFLVSANDSRPLIARWLFRMRIDQGLSLRQVAARMGASSSEAWARYESGRASPTMEKLEELLHAVDPRAEFTLKKITTTALKKVG
ncbi:MAG: type II toxin-antitoxin system HicB family antitoxin [Steroidobacteraceae bacterium]